MITTFKRSLLVSLAIIFGSIAIAVAALSYFAGTVASDAQTIAKDRSLTDQQTGALDVLADLKEQAPQAAMYQAAMDKLLPTQDGLIDFPQWVDGVAARHQVVASVSFGETPLPPSGKNEPGIAPFSITLTGSLADIAACLDDMESKSPGFFMQMTDFNLIDQSPDYELTGQGNLFFR